MKPSRLAQALILLLILLVAGVAWFHRSAPSPVAPSTNGSSKAPTTSISPEPLRPGPTEAPVVPVQGKQDPTPEPEKPKAPRTLRINGKVTDASGAVVPFLKIEIFDRSLRGTLVRLDTESDAEGAFHADCPEFSRVTFTAHLPGHGRAFSTIEIGDPDQPFGRTSDVTVILRRATPFDGVLALPDGSPAGGATLTFHPFATKYTDERLGAIGMNVLLGTAPRDEAWDRRCRTELFLKDATAVTDAQGRFRAESLSAGVTYLIGVEREGSPRVLLETHVRGQKAPAVLRLPE